MTAAPSSTPRVRSPVPLTLGRARPRSGRDFARPDLWTACDSLGDEPEILDNAHELRPIGYLPAMTSCSKCSDPAQVAMSFAYSAKSVWLRDLGPGFDRYADYPLCEMHAERLSAPAGWAVSDERANEPPLFLTSDVA